MEQITLNMDNVEYPAKGKLYMGLDCSSKAIHSVWVDDQERLIAQCKWGSKKKNSEERFLDFGVDFWDSLSKIRLILAIAKWGEDKFPEQDFADAACIALWKKRRVENVRRT